MNQISQTGVARRAVDIAPRGKTPNRVAINAWHQKKRALNKAAGRCINGPVTDRGKQHAPPAPGNTKCAACVEAHRRSR